MNATSEKLADALRALFDSCAMAHKYWGDGDNTEQANAAITAARAALAAYDAERRAESEAETLTCTQCGHAVDPLAVFPGGRCIDCYRPEGEALARTMTASKLTKMWGGR